jgi:pimeloyl-ACP methyl ester carboxylesterase
VSRPGADPIGSGGPAAWALRQRAVVGADTIAWDRLGDGPPVVLVHGTPSWSYIWRNIAPALAAQHTVYLLDLIGYGDSQKREEQDMSVAAQSRALAQLLDYWRLERPALIGHDIGAAIVLRTHLIEWRRASRITIVEGAVFRPWNTPATLHMKAHLDAYTTMPAHIYERVVAGHLTTATHRPMEAEVLAAYLRP